MWKSETQTAQEVAVSETSPKQRVYIHLRVFLIGLWSLILVLSNNNQIYTIATWNNKKQCYQTRVKNAAMSAPFVWLTSWILWLSTAFFIIFAWYEWKRTNQSVEDGSSSISPLRVSWAFRCFFQTILCGSLATILAYSIGLVVAPPDVDTDLCLAISDSVVQRSQRHAEVWLIMDRIFNVTAHYLCGVVLFFSIYVSGRIQYDIKTPFVSFFSLGFALILGLVDTFHAPVYDVDNIWINGLYIIVGVTVIHCALYSFSRRCIQPHFEECCCQQDETLNDVSGTDRSDERV